MAAQFRIRRSVRAFSDRITDIYIYIYIYCVCVCVCVCVCIPILVTTFPQVAQRYGTIAAHTRHRASVLVVFVVFCVHMHNFAGLIRRTPPPTFSDTAVTDRHSDTTIFQLRAHWVRVSCSIGSENRSDLCPRWESNPQPPACKASTLSTRPGSPRNRYMNANNVLYTYAEKYADWGSWHIFPNFRILMFCIGLLIHCASVL